MALLAVEDVVIWHEGVVWKRNHDVSLLLSAVPPAQEDVEKQRGQASWTVKRVLTENCALPPLSVYAMAAQSLAGYYLGAEFEVSSSLMMLPVETGLKKAEQPLCELETVF